MALQARDPLHESIDKQLVWIGMGYKAKTAAIAEAIARIFNAVDRPSPRKHASI